MQSMKRLISMVFAVDWWSNEMSNFHRTISINLNGGSSSFMTWSWELGKLFCCNK